ncbi:hypothetical protein ATI61_10280 [Archangium gephyra]|nr:hypothetical protein ATI61_10280 [Archangium gephyra]
MSRRKKTPIRRKNATRRETPSHQESTTRTSETKVTALPPELLAPPDVQPWPPVDPRAGVLPMHQLTWPDFERLLVAIASHVLGFGDARLYGVAGQAQHGLDVIARTTQGEPRALQGKNVKSFDKADLQKAINKFAKGKRPFNCQWLAIAVACNTDRTEVLDELHRLRNLYPKLTIELWGENQLSTMLRDHPHLVRLFFGTEWERLFCDPAKAANTQQYTDSLHALLSSSRARLITRWLAAGVEEGDAEKFADDATIGVPPTLKDSLPETGLICIEGEFGSGKSVFGERIHQLDVMAALNNASSPIPIHLTARFIRGSLEAEIQSVATSMGNFRRLGVRVVIDGLDEPGLERASDLLEQSRVLARSWPQTRIIATARIGVASNRQERIAMPLLTTEEQQVLLSRIAGSPHVTYKWPPPVLEAIRRPLFLLIAASLHRDSIHYTIPRSPASFLEALVRKALGRNAKLATEARLGLLRLATLTLAAGGAVALGEFGTERDQETLVDTRLAIQHGKSLIFSLPIIEQYFGAQALLDGLIQPDWALESMESLERWRYAFVLATALGGWDKVSNLLEKLATRHLGTAIWITTEAVSEHASKDDSLPTLPVGIECARRLRRALTTWMTELPVSKLTRLARPNGSAHTVAARSEGSRLTASMKNDDAESAEADIIELPVNIHSFNNIDQSWFLLRSAHAPSAEAGWPWRWALQWIDTEVEQLLKQEALPVQPNSSARAEQRWAVAKWLLNRGGELLHRPLPADQLKATAENLLNGLSNEPWRTKIHITGRMTIHTEALQQIVSELVAEGESSSDSLLHRPWAVPDNSTPRNQWISSLYTDETLRLLVEQVYQAALDIHNELVTTWFPNLQDALSWSAARPFRLDGLLEISYGNNAWEDNPGLDYRIQPLPNGERTIAVVKIGSKQDIMALRRDVAHELEDKIKSSEFLRWHPASPPGIRLSALSSWTSTVLHVFGDTPATDLAYEWLWNDLHDLRLIRSTPPASIY